MIAKTSNLELSELQESGASKATSFLTGFSVGLFVGAAGYYLYATDRGKKLREHVSDEWKTAKVELAKGGVIRDSDISMRELFAEVIQKMFVRGQKVRQSPDSPVKEVRKHRLLASTKSKTKAG
jgi:gas vesicle protein